MDGDPSPADRSPRRPDTGETNDGDPPSSGHGATPGSAEAEHTTADGLSVRLVSARLDALDADVSSLAGIVQHLAGSVQNLARESRPAPADDAPGPDGDPAGLARWVRWLVRTYELDMVIPECWAEHGAYVGELSALWTGWLATIGDGATGLDAMHWHDLAGRAFERLRGLYRTCTDGTHRPRTGLDWASSET